MKKGKLRMRSWFSTHSISCIALTLLSAGSMAAIPGEPIYNVYTASVVTSEPVTWRENAEKSLLTGSTTTAGELADGLNFLFTEAELLNSWHTFTDARKQDLLSLVGTFEATVWLEMNDPYTSLDCDKIANQIDASGQTHHEKSLTSVHCHGDTTQQQLSEAKIVRPAVYQYNKTDAVDAVYVTKSKTVCKFKLLFCWSKETVTWQELVSASYIDHYDMRQYEIWNASPGNATASGKWVEEWSYFNIEKGLIPIDVSGITVFVKGDVKKNEPWIVNNDVSDKNIRTASDIDVFSSGSRLKLVCGKKEFFSDISVTNDLTTMPISHGLGQEIKANCQTEDVKFKFENLNSNYQDASGYEAILDIVPKFSLLSAQDAIALYAKAISEDLNTQYERYYRYYNLFRPYEYGDLDISLIDIEENKLVVSTNSSTLQLLMDRYRVENPGVEGVPTSFEVSKLFFTYIEANQWADARGIPSGDRSYLTGTYKPAVDPSVVEPAWYKGFETWYYSLDDAANYTSPSNAVAGIEVAIGLIYADIFEMPIHYPFASELYESWSQLSDTYTIALRFDDLMNENNPNVAATSAYGTDASSIDAYNSAKLRVSSHLNKTLLQSFPHWNVLTANNPLSIFGDGSPN